MCALRTVSAAKDTAQVACATQDSAPTGINASAEQGDRTKWPLVQRQGGGHGPLPLFYAGSECHLRSAHGGIAQIPLTKWVKVPYLFSMGAIDLKGQTMIQDRLTAKFLNAQSAKRKEAKPLLAVAPKADKAPATDLYTRGRSLFGTFWL